MRSFGVALMKDVHEPAGVGRKTGGGRDQVEQAVMEV